MNWPQHQEPPDFHRATAPYNFVRLPERVLTVDAPFEAHDRLASDRLHGEITLTVVTETPLYTRCAYRPEDDLEGDGKAMKSLPLQEFYHRGDPERPVIPGASLRGAIRNLVEILAYSRLSRRDAPGEGARVIDTRLVHRAVADQQTPVGKRYAERFLRKIASSHFEYPGPDVKAGYLEELSGGRWSIRPAKQHLGTSFIRVGRRLQERQMPHLKLNIEKDDERDDAAPIPVYVRPVASGPHRPPTQGGGGGLTLEYALTDRLEAELMPGLVEALLIPTGMPVRRSLYYAVYERDPSAKPIEIPPEMVRQWEEDCALKRGLPNRKVRKGEPVFYLLERGKLIFFGPCLFFRLPYRRFTMDYAPQPTARGKADEKNLDMAEAIFGTVNPGERKRGRDVEGSHRGRVYFEDAECQTPDPFMKGRDGGRRYPGVLSAPKPTSYQLYLVQPNPLGADEKSRKNALMAYDAPSPSDGESHEPTTVLRGFKRYWHRRNVPDSDGAPRVEDMGPDHSGPGLYQAAPEKHESQFTRIRPVKSGVTFSGRIRFENLTAEELGALLTALELPPSCRHHLGMGKSLGMGSVQLKTHVTLSDPLARYRSLSGVALHKDQSRLLEDSRKKFRELIISFHNQSVRSPQLPLSAELWSIPRLNELRTLLEWDHQPSRRETRPQELKVFKARRVLPSPLGVQGLSNTLVEATVPLGSAGSVPGTSLKGGHAAPSSASLDEVGIRPAPEEMLRGVISRFTQNAIQITPDGKAPIELIPDIDIFPLTLWKKFTANNFVRGRQVRIQMRVGKVVKVEPA